MAFLTHSTDDGRVPSIEYFPSDIPMEVGKALAVTDGKLTVVSGTSKPAYISVCKKDMLGENDLAGVIRVLPDMIFEADYTGDAPNGAVGITSDGMNADPAASGCGEVVYVDEANKKVRIRFADAAPLG